MFDQLSVKMGPYYFWNSEFIFRVDKGLEKKFQGFSGDPAIQTSGNSSAYCEHWAIIHIEHYMYM